MSISTYDAIFGSTQNISYTTASPAITYPEPSMYNVLGPVYLPRVYAGGLDTFEVGSSGKITFSLTDAQRLDLLQSGSRTILVATSSNDFFIQNNASNAFLGIQSNAYAKLATAADASISASNSTVIDAGVFGAFNVGNSNLIFKMNNTAHTISLSNAYSDGTVQTIAGAQISSVVGTQSLSLNSNGRLTGLAASMVSYALNDESSVFQQVSSNISGYAAKTVAFSTLTSNAYSRLTDKNAALFGSNLVNVVSGSASNASVSLDGFGGNTNIAGVTSVGLTSGSTSQTFTAATNTIRAAAAVLHNTASDSIQNVATNKIVLTSASSNASVSLTDSNVSSYAIDQVTSSTQSNNSYLFLKKSNTALFGSNLVNVVSGSASNASVSLDGFGGNTNIAGVTTVGVTSGSASQTFTSSTNTIRTTAAVLYDTASDSIQKAATNRLVWTTTDSNAYSRYMTGGYISDYGAQRIVSVAGATSNAYIVLDTATQGTTLFGTVSNNVITGDSNTFLKQWTSNSRIFSAQRTELAVHNSNAWIVLDAVNGLTMSTSNVFNTSSVANTGIYSANNVAVAAGNSNSYLTMGVNGSAVLVGTQSLSLSSSNTTISSSANTSFVVGGNTLLSLSPNTMTLYGDFDIYGNINAISVSQTNLNINDKTINLAVTDGSVTVDGFATNNKSGILISGMPSGYQAVTDSNNVFQKGLLWNYAENLAAGTAAGVLMNGGESLTDESFWEVLGGSLRLTTRRQNTMDAFGSNIQISYAFRINSKDELELVKRAYDSNSTLYQYKRVAKFGVTR